MNQLKQIYLDLRDEIFDAIDASTLSEISNEELAEQLSEHFLFPFPTLGLPIFDWRTGKR